jgi:gamma-glutamyltranspeptidase/glutathione hydrolase
MRRKSVILLLSAAVLLLAQRDSKRDQAVRQSVRGMRAAIAAGSDYASEAGMRILHKGGNAVDGGLASMFAASVCEFSHFGFGGEAPILIRTKEGKVISLAGVGTMPTLASADMFRNRRIRMVS